MALHGTPLSGRPLWPALCVAGVCRLKKVLLFALTISLSLIVGLVVGWWANSPGMDLLCSEPSVAELAEDVEAQGVIIEAGTLVDLRSCEYAERFTVNLYYPKNPTAPIFKPRNSAPNIGNHGADQYEVEKAGK